MRASATGSDRRAGFWTVTVPPGAPVEGAAAMSEDTVGVMEPMVRRARTLRP